jgi:hypothetical protein
MLARLVKKMDRPPSKGLLEKIERFNKTAQGLSSNEKGTIELSFSETISRKLWGQGRSYLRVRGLPPNGVYVPQILVVPHRGLLLLFQEKDGEELFHAYSFGPLFGGENSHTQGVLTYWGNFETRDEILRTASLDLLSFLEDAWDRRVEWAAGTALDVEIAAARLNARSIQKSARFSPGGSFYTQSSFSGRVRRFETNARLNTKWELSVLLSPQGPWLVGRSVNSVKFPVIAFGPLSFDKTPDASVPNVWKSKTDMDLKNSAQALSEVFRVGVSVPRSERELLLVNKERLDKSGAKGFSKEVILRARGAMGDWAQNWHTKKEVDRRRVFNDMVESLLIDLGTPGTTTTDLRRVRNLLILVELLLSGKPARLISEEYETLLNAPAEDLPSVLKGGTRLNEKRTFWLNRLKDLSKAKTMLGLGNTEVYFNFLKAMDHFAPRSKNFSRPQSLLENKFGTWKNRDGWRRWVYYPATVLVIPWLEEWIFRSAVFDAQGLPALLSLLGLVDPFFVSVLQWFLAVPLFIGLHRDSNIKVAAVRLLPALISTPYAPGC